VIQTRESLDDFQQHVGPDGLARYASIPVQALLLAPTITFGRQGDDGDSPTLTALARTTIRTGNDAARSHLHFEFRMAREASKPFISGICQSSAPGHRAGR